jgi:O-antigen/teichoic acid export membrane protein
MSAIAASMGRFGSLLQRYTARPELRQATVLASGSVIAQVLTVATTPILARIYGPSEYGALASLLSISTIGGSIGSLCYETAILLPRGQRTATALFALSLWLSWITAALVTSAVWAIAYAVPSQLDVAPDGTFLISCYLCTVFTTLFNTLGYAHARASQFKPIAVSKINQSWATSVFQIALGLTVLHPIGLVIGRVAGLAATVGWLARDLPRGFRTRDVLQAPSKGFVVAARSYRDFVLNVPRQLLVRGATSLPAVLILASYGPAAAGLFFFGVRLVERPGALLGDALSRVPMRQFAERRMKGQRLARAALLYTAALAVPILLAMALLVLTARPLFALAFGEQWVSAADYSVILAVWASVRLISLPMSTLIAVLRVQAVSLAIDSVFFTRIFVIPIMAAHGAGPLAAVTAFCTISIVYHAILFALGLGAALRHDRTLAPSSALPAEVSSHV